MSCLVAHPCRQARRTFSVHHHCLTGGGDEAHDQRLVDAGECTHAGADRAQVGARVVAAEDALPWKLGKDHVGRIALIGEWKSCSFRCKMGGDVQCPIRQACGSSSALCGRRLISAAVKATTPRPARAPRAAPEVTCTLAPCCATAGRLQLAASRRHSWCASGWLLLASEQPSCGGEGTASGGAVP